MNIQIVLEKFNHIFLDTAPVIYYLEKNPYFFTTVEPIFKYIQSGNIIAVTSPITLAECLIVPIRMKNSELAQTYQKRIMHGKHTQFIAINGNIGLKAAQLTAIYNLALSDAIQIATAIESNCDGFLTNDKRLKRVSDLHVLLVDEIIV
ncbi:MAG: VapC toxin family PIN domain ribonuclease [Anaerolineaceae bacterium 4572_78]|nr:MAG: VapC toxin family PIN domain ribonuclease [Anaerolineaceae bacterium 4572_78]